MDAELSPILRLPPELLLLVLDILEISDILCVRQTCRTLSKVTYERSIWMQKLEEQETYLPLPTELLHAYHHEDRHLHAYSDSAIESIVTNTANMSNMWLRPRSALSYRLEREEVGKTLMGLKLFLDRWLMVVYYEGAAYLYDTQPVQQPPHSSIGSQSEQTGRPNANSKPILRAELFLESGLWITHVAAVDSREQTLFLALSRSVPPHMVQIYEVNLMQLTSNTLFDPHGFHLAKTISLPFYKVIRAIEPTQRFITLSTSGAVELVKWDQWGTDMDDANPKGRQIIRVNPDDLEGLWNGIIAVHFLGGYVLIFRTRSVEVHKHPLTRFSTESESQPILKHKFSMTYREVSFSQTTVSRDLISETETYETTLFAYDVLQGLFHYTVRLQDSMSHANESPPSFEVILTGAYPLAPASLHSSNLYVPLASEDTPVDTVPSKPVTYSANFTPSPSPTSAFSHTHAHVPGAFSTTRLTPGGQFDDGSRGFLSTHAMGPQGKRGIWVERKRSSTLREIQVWTRNSPSLLSSYEDQLSASNTSAIEIPRRVVYSLYSYDLRDDITCCSFGELNGTIILGHRSGDVSILEL